MDDGHNLNSLPKYTFAQCSGHLLIADTSDAVKRCFRGTQCPPPQWLFIARTFDSRCQKTLEFRATKVTASKIDRAEVFEYFNTRKKQNLSTSLIRYIHLRLHEKDGVNKNMDCRLKQV